MPSIEELEARAECKVTRPKNYKEADDADIRVLFPEVMKNCGDKLAECMCEDHQKVAALAATCVGASDASNSWLLLGHHNTVERPFERFFAKRFTEVPFSLFAAERDAYCRRWLARAAAGDVTAIRLVARLYLGHKQCACEASQQVMAACGEDEEECLEIYRNLVDTLGTTIVNVYGEEVGYVHVGLLELLAGDTVPPRCSQAKSEARNPSFPHVAWAKVAADRNAFAKEVNTADIAPERLAQFRVSYDTPLSSLVKVLSVAWIDGKRTIIGCVGGERIVAILHAHCGLYKARDEAIDLSSVAAFDKTYGPILVRTMDKDSTLRYGTSLGYEFSPPHRLLAAAVGAKNREDFKAGTDEALDPKLVDCNGFPDCESALRFWLLQLRLRKMLNTPNAVPGNLRAAVLAYSKLDIKWATSKIDGVTVRPLLDYKNSKKIKQQGGSADAQKAADFIECQYLLSNVDAYSEALPLALRAATYLEDASEGRYDITEDDLKAYIAERQLDADRAMFDFERENILGRSPRLRLAALLRYSSILTKVQLEDLVKDVECLERTWSGAKKKGHNDAPSVSAKVQAQLRAALAELPESDPPDPNCPVGARVKVEFDEDDAAPEFGYIVECRDDKYYIVFDDYDADDWYELDEGGLTVLGASE
ncbi:unnamed protein product [Pelagomonas calceolata]|uniref:Uncharacterized protein n=2 Tax=Pelagomonas calceolata TaxID=35677 RepID=A0A8J2WSH5_9STRA|nr:unnamed protein product [Pelagomonas calceolata]